MARAFYKARRIDEGDEMVMKAGNMLPPLHSEDSRRFVKILCKTGMFEHAVRVFEMMSRDGERIAIAEKGSLPMKEMSVYLSDGTVLKGLSDGPRAKYWEICAACGKTLNLGVAVNGSCGSVVVSAYINALTRVYSDVQSAEGDDATRPSSVVLEAWLRGVPGLGRAGMDTHALMINNLWDT
ncbi:hypothetical protein QJS10_CPA10g01834 [Acorus calamus]|uniref:Pentatricopeptide repeat-containing protein n=1 Tax=Acorus calamus TaxID=4465 RepID=A0AAV9E1P0_ACOCL|nr:hypothetical protein QJS10_CPA10g01834 [Acorus calamus]